MTVGQLKEVLSKYDDNMEVVIQLPASTELGQFFKITDNLDIFDDIYELEPNTLIIVVYYGVEEKQMTVGQLKEVLSKYDDNMEVVIQLPASTELGQFFKITGNPDVYDDFYEFDTNTLIIVVYDRADGIDRTIEND